MTAVTPSRHYRSMAGAVRYHWRDPAYLTPAQRAVLEGRDKPETPYRPGPPPTARNRETARRDFADAREAGLSVSQAAAAAGVERRTGPRWESLRIAGHLFTT
jgi:hypothetical protein